MKCKQCSVELTGSVNKKYCSESCKSKFKYHNNPGYKESKIFNVYKQRMVNK